jgi:1-acyl-sn-glycerol-3-phosphate acyltransferase
MTSAVNWKVWFLYQMTRIYCVVMFRWKARNTCTIPESGPAIIIANHTSPVDPILLWMRHCAAFEKPHLRIIGYMMAREYFEVGGLVGWVCRVMESIPVARSGRDMGPARKALERLKAGQLLGVFPEGGINSKAPDSQLRAGGSGTAWLALKSGAPVIPVFIHGAPRSKSLVRCFFTPSRAELIYGQPVDLSEWLDRKPSQETLQEVTDHLMESLASLGGLQHTPIAKNGNSRRAEEPSA